ncbi:MAG: AAA family ATPase [Treponema sp.]|nr:AAA family ATPase [Treponema sp.]
MFLTGVTKFAQLSVFSDLNRLIDLTLDPAFRDITPEEPYRTSFVQK